MSTIAVVESSHYFSLFYLFIFISDDDNSGYESDEAEEEDEDIDLDDFVEEDEADLEEEETSMPPKKKKATPRKVSTPDPMDELTNTVSKMSVAAPTSFCMDFQYPFIMTTYNEQLDVMCKVEFYVPTIPKEYFVPDVVNGNVLTLKTQVPGFFVQEQRVLESNADNGEFNQNTHEAQAFKNQCEEIDKYFGFVDAIFGDKAQEVPLPFVCEDRIVDCEFQAYPNELGDLTDQFGGLQFFGCVSVKLRKLKAKRRTTGGFRIIGAANMDGDGN